jgi:hypothetical protein
VFYDGAFRNSEPHGVGKMTYKDGRICDGIWKNGKIEYEGELVDGKPHGRGKKVYKSGAYEGEWKDGCLHGQGIMKLTNGFSYKGEWKDNKKHGKGTYKWANGSSYEGEYKDDKKHGRGIEKRPDGSVQYEGEVKDDKANGNGTYNFENGGVYTGVWSAGKKNGKGVMTYANQDVYDGEWKMDCKDGRGIMKYHNGDVYDDEFCRGKMHDKGTYSYADWDIFKSIGEWKDGKKFGFFEDVVRVSKQVYYDIDEVRSDSKVKLQHHQMKTPILMSSHLDASAAMLACLLLREGMYVYCIVEYRLVLSMYNTIMIRTLLHMVHKLNVDNIRENSLQEVLPELSNESPLDDGYEVDVTPIARKMR